MNDSDVLNVPTLKEHIRELEQRLEMEKFSGNKERIRKLEERIERRKTEIGIDWSQKIKGVWKS